VKDSSIIKQHSLFCFVWTTLWDLSKAESARGPKNWSLHFAVRLYIHENSANRRIKVVMHYYLPIKFITKFFGNWRFQRKNHTRSLQYYNLIFEPINTSIYTILSIFFFSIPNPYQMKLVWQRNWGEDCQWCQSVPPLSKCNSMKSAALIYRERDLLRNGGLARNSYLVTINSNANEKW
jgi:hypothetical protein